MIWEMTEFTEKFKQYFSSLSGKLSRPLFFLLNLGEMYVFVRVHALMTSCALIDKAKIRQLPGFICFRCFLNFRGKSAKLSCWPFPLFWKMHSRWKLAGKNFRLTQLEMFKHSTQWSSQGKIWQTFYISGNVRAPLKLPNRQQMP